MKSKGQGVPQLGPQVSKQSLSLCIVPVDYMYLRATGWSSGSQAYASSGADLRSVSVLLPPPYPDCLQPCLPRAHALHASLLECRLTGDEGQQEMRVILLNRFGRLSMIGKVHTRKQFYEVASRDPHVLVAGTIIMAGVSITACSTVHIV